MGLAKGYTYPVSLQFCDEEQFECTVQKMHPGLIGSQVPIGMMYTGSKAHADEAKGLIGSLPNRAWLVSANQATSGQAQRVQDEYVWLTGRSS